MKKMRKWHDSMLTSVLLMSVLLAGCGANQNTPESSPDQASNNVDEPVTLTMFSGAKEATGTNMQNLIKDFTAQTGIKVEMNVIPGDGVEVFKKIDVALATGDSTDIVGMSNPLLIKKYSENDLLLPLNDIMKEDGYDADTVFGKYLTKTGGNVYVLPSDAGRWAVYYNKKLFDEAKVPYPKGEWTWDQYIETAKKLTDSSKGIYGSYMLDYDAYMYMTARQHNVSGYKEDGTSNYDDPAFAESLKWFGDLGNTHKIQPSWLEFKSKKLSWDGFMSGKYAMHFIGSWYTNMFLDKTAYPRDWQFGITQVPVPADGKGNNNVGITSGPGVNKNSKHPKEAFQFVKFLAENSYKYTGNLPARVDLTAEDINTMFQATVDKLGGEVTAEELDAALISNNLGFADEKIIGTAADEYNNMILQEAELYLVGQKSIEETVKSIKERADQAIAAGTAKQ